MGPSCKDIKITLLAFEIELHENNENLSKFSDLGESEPIQNESFHISL